MQYSVTDFIMIMNLMADCTRAAGKPMGFPAPVFSDIFKDKMWVTVVTVIIYGVNPIILYGFPTFSNTGLQFRSKQYV
jgi:hypothetical protein